MSIDPLAPEYPHNSPYAFSENRVIDKIELEGLETADPDEGFWGMLKPGLTTLIYYQLDHSRRLNENLGIEPTLENNLETSFLTFSLFLTPFAEATLPLLSSQNQGLRTASRVDPGDWRLLSKIPASAGPLKVQSGRLIFPEQGRRLVSEATRKAKSLISSLSNKKRGPVLTSVMDANSGKIFYGQNTGVPENLHPILKSRYQALVNRTGGAGNRPHYVNEIPGSHSEINALNEALWAREKATGRAVREDELGEFLLHNRSLQGSKKGEGVPPRCLDCAELTEGVSVIGGN